jgi:hypothetical protein
LEAHIQTGDDATAFASLPINVAIRRAAREGKWP